MEQDKIDWDEVYERLDERTQEFVDRTQVICNQAVILAGVESDLSGSGAEPFRRLARHIMTFVDESDEVRLGRNDTPKDVLQKLVLGEDSPDEVQGPE